MGESGIINVYGGAFTGNDLASTFGNELGAFYLSDATLNVYGGSITNNGEGRVDIASYGRVNLYAGTIGAIRLYTAGDGMSINGGSSTPLVVEALDFGKPIEMLNGKLPAGSSITLSLYKNETVTVTSGYTAAGYEGPDDIFVYGTYGGATNYETYGYMENNEVVAATKQPHTHTVNYYGQLDATCEEDGHFEYYYCPDCGKYYSDYDMTDEITADSIVIEKTGHTLIHKDATTSTCCEKGMAEHYECSVCGKFFSDAAGNNEVTQASIESPLLSHTAGEPTYHWEYYDDRVECWAEVRCSVCHSGITGEVFTWQIDKTKKNIVATFEKIPFVTQTVVNPYFEGSDCFAHWILIAITVLFIGFYVCWYTVLRNKNFTLFGKLKKNMLPLLVCGLMLVIVLIFGIIGLTNSCGICIAFFIIDLLLIGIGVALYFFDSKIPFLATKQEEKTVEPATEDAPQEEPKEE